MKTVTLSRTVAAPARTMFSVVADTSSYGLFLPCSVESEPPDIAVPCRRKAVMRAGYWPFLFDMETENSFDPPRLVGIRLAKPGTLSRLEALWDIRPLAFDSCEVSFRAGYAFSSESSSVLLSPAIEALLSSISDSFARRAETIHAGKGDAP